MSSKLSVLQSVGLWNLDISENSIGGTEIFTYNLDKELTKRGIDSRVITWLESILYLDEEKRRIIPFVGTVGKVDEFLYREGENVTCKRYEVELEEINGGNYSLVHSQSSDTFKFGKKIKIPIVTTIHMPVESFFYKEDLDKNGVFVCISNRQKNLYELSGWKIDHVIYNGVDPEEFSFLDKKDNFLLHLSRISTEKGVDNSIKVAKRIGLDLIIAGGVDEDKESRDYYKNNIKPRIDVDLSREDDKYSSYKSLNEGNGRIIYAGKVSKKQKKSLYEHSKCLLAPVMIEESFGLTIIESLASGTPVVGFNKGAIPEIIKHGDSGYIVNNLEEMIIFSKEIERINPKNCRQRVLDKFTLQRMTDEYINLYESLI